MLEADDKDEQTESSRLKREDDVNRIDLKCGSIWSLSFTQ